MLKKYNDNESTSMYIPIGQVTFYFNLSVSRDPCKPSADLIVDKVN